MDDTSRRKGDTETLADGSAAQSAEAYYASVLGIRPKHRVEPAHLDTDALSEPESQERGVLVYEPAGKASTRESSAQAADEGSSGESDRAGQQGIGYRLLRRAGWKGSGGLGAQEQGIASPIPAWKQRGRQGIGTRSKAPDPPLAAHPSAEHLPSTSTPGGSTAVRDGSEKQKDESRKRAPKRDWESVRVEEAVETKVKRWKQVLQAEADDRVSKAIDRYMFRAFRDDDADSNPLLRRHNLSISNPLL